MLNNRQKNQLRVLGNSLTALGQIGKNGISDNLLDFLDEALEDHELIKVNVLKNSSMELPLVTELLLEKLGCELVLAIGRMLLLYRQSSKQERIKLVK